MNKPNPHLSGAVEAPMKLSTAPYISPEYARAEKNQLWLKTWQVACREEEIPQVGDFYTYEILDQSVIVLRLSEDEIVAYHNACRHRGRRLLQGCGRATHFQCPYHGWTYDLDGANTFILDKENWSGALDDAALRLKTVKTGRWGGFVFVNLDDDCGPLEDFLQEVPYWLGVFETGKMRYKWRQWLRMDCNWKVAVEAFIEGYHAETTHPQIAELGGGKTGSSAEGLHARLFQVGSAGGGIGTGVNEKDDIDVRNIPYLGLKQAQETIWSNTSETFVEAARRLPDLLPEGVDKMQVSMKLMEVACQLDAERGVKWPQVDPMHMAQVGINWHVFPNTVLLPNVTFCLGFRMRPDGFNPDSSIMEVFALERYPEGEEPETQWEHKPEQTGDSWPLLIKQDFRNLAEQQAGMHSVSLSDGLHPNPVQEASVINFQRNLADYMGEHAPELLEPGKG
ncbi:MAG: aromatic ring-hydroxylating dioxygenase subunit alpha [Novosphingobium sp.]|nr:aromatic ring-hydroxylating dioxygenase subunit alpha [Novosphingobium sp.]